MTDFASLGMKIDSTQVKQGVTELDRLTAAGARAEAATLGMGKGSKAAAVAASEMAASAQLSARAAVGVSAGFGAATNAVRGNTVAMRESLVVSRELLSGNLTRLPGSLSILAQQFSTSGKSASGFASQILQSFGIIKKVTDTELAGEAAAAAASAAAIRSVAERAAANVTAADTELALAHAAIKTAATTEALTAAQARLATAHEAVAVAAEEATVAEVALADAAGTADTAIAASAAATSTVLGPIGIALAGIAVVGGIAFGAIKQFQDQVRESGELDRYAESLRLTDEQIRKAGGSIVYLGHNVRQISGLTVSFGDVMYGVWHEIAREISDPGPWNTMAKNASTVFTWMLGAWSKVSAGITAGLMSMANFTLEMAKGGMHGADLSKLDPLGDFQRRYADELKRNQVAFTNIEKGALEHKERMLKIESDANNPPKPKKQSDHGLAEALAELDAQIKGQKALASAYLVSDAAAQRAEAAQKAEEEAIKHKGAVALFYERELQKAVFTDIADSAKHVASIRDETDARSKVNDMVAAGLIPASQASAAIALQGQLTKLATDAENGNADAKALAAKVTKELTAATAALNEQIAREAALRQIGQNNDETDRLKLEASLIGATNRERAVALAQLQAEQFIKNNGIKDTPDDPTLVARTVQSYIAAAQAQATLSNGQLAYNVQLTATEDHLKLIAEQTQSLGQIMSDAFGSAGDAIGGVLNSLSAWQAKEQEIADWKKASLKDLTAGTQAYADVEAQASQKSATAQMQAIGGVLESAKGLFKAHSAGYKAMEAAEKAYALLQLINTVKYVAAGAAKMFSQLGVWAFPAVAAMIAVMAGLGFASGSSTQAPPTSPEDLQKAAGTGTVLGDSAAKSASIANSLELMAKNSTKGLDYSSDMARSLRNIQSGIGDLTAAIARQLQMQGGFYDTTGKLGTNSSGGLFGIGGLFSSTTTKSLYDQGLQFSPSTISQIIAQGISGATYQIIQTVKQNSGFLGIGGSTKTSYSTTTGALPDDISRQVQLITQNLYSTVVDAAKVLGLDVGDALKQFQVDIGQISFKDLTGDEIQKQLEAVFSKLGDQMAGFAVSGLAGFQKAGEGLYETLMRLAKDYLTIDTALQSIGMTFGSVGASSIAAREALIELAGGLDNFVSQVNFFYDHFLTDAQKAAFEQTQVDAAFKAMGVAEPTTLAGFAALVQGLDLSTTAGQAMYEQLMQIAPAFYDIATAAEQLAQKQQQLQIQLYQAQGNDAAATALQRQITLAATDPSLQDLQKQVWAAQDAAAAAAKALQLANDKTKIQIALLQAQGNAEGALALQRKQELAQLDPSLRALQEQVYKAQDIATAKDALSQAYQRESAALQQTADTFRKFADDLKTFRDSLFTTGNSALSYSQALIALMKQSGLANAGDQNALGGGLQTASQTFLDIATANASTLQDVERARALVARTLDQAIGGAASKASVAEQQLDQMKTQVGALIDINDSVLSVHDAIVQLRKLMFPSSPGGTQAGGGTGGNTGGTGSHHAPTREDYQQIIDQLGHIRDATQRGAVSSNKVAKIFRNADRNGAIAMVTDPDSPIATVPAA